MLNPLKIPSLLFGKNSQSSTSKTIDEREVTLNQPFHSSALYIVAFEEAKDLLEKLEKNGFLEKKDVIHEGTPRLLLEDFISEILSKVTKPAKVGSKITIKALQEGNNLKIKIIDGISRSSFINTKGLFSFSDLVHSIGWSMDISKVSTPHISINLPISPKRRSL